jgi:acylphosphatase
VQKHPEIQREVFFSGNVQGVGFRFQTCEIARNFAVTGYVENLDDGRVHLLAEGSAGELDRFMAEIQQDLGRFIRQNSMAERTGSGEYQRFEIRH